MVTDNEPQSSRQRAAKHINHILDQPGPVLVALKVVPEVENKPIGQRKPWRRRDRDQVIQDLKIEIGIKEIE